MSYKAKFEPGQKVLITVPRSNYNLLIAYVVHVIPPPFEGAIIYYLVELVELNKIARFSEYELTPIQQRDPSTITSWEEVEEVCGWNPLKQ